jgi:alpha-beta hydrolase superfamily lysophospholipase
MTRSMLDQPQISQVLFHPRPEPGSGSAIPGVRPISLEVEPGISLGGWLYPAAANAPVVLFFHGNGEIAADYDFIAPAYTELGLSLLVMDYRGYGTSDGQPTATHLLADAVTVFNALEDLWQIQQLSPDRLYVMGRSLGSAAAIEVAVHAGVQLAGLIIESGFADTSALLARLGAPVSGLNESQTGFGNTAKMARVTRPTLIVHGQNDSLIPASEGETLYRRSGAADKRLVLIPGAGHNDLLLAGYTRYFEAIAAFIK